MGAPSYEFAVFHDYFLVALRKLEGVYVLILMFIASFLWNRKIRFALIEICILGTPGKLHVTIISYTGILDNAINGF